MKFDCCDIKVTETEKGFSVEVAGEKFKEMCKGMMDNCCTESNVEKETSKECCTDC